MTDKLTAALNAADMAAMRRVRYRTAADQVTAEADALVAQAEAKRVEAQGILAEAERQDAAYEAAIALVVEQGVERVDVEGMVATRVKMLVKAGVDVPLPSVEPSRPKPKASAQRKAKPPARGEAGEGPAAEVGEGDVGEGGAPVEERPGAGNPASEQRQEGRQPFRLPDQPPSGDQDKGD